MEGMLGRLVIDNVRPRTLTGRYPAKAAVGDRVPVTAWIHREGHDLLAGRVWWRPRTPDGAWRHAPLTDDGNDEWSAWFEPTAVGMHEFAVEAWADHFATWAHDLRIRAEAGDDLELELEEGARLIDRLAARLPPEAAAPPAPVADAGAPTPLERLAEAAATLRRTSCAESVRVAAGLDPDVAAILRHVPDPFDRVLTEPQLLWVDRERARSSAWYELFPRSEGGLQGRGKRLPAVADMGFDVVYLPPVHPIGTTARKGPGNTLVAGPDDPGSPWAIGAAAGGHLAVEPRLGTLDDFDDFVADAAANGLEVALDYALQCSPDHPWVSEHPEWFHRRPDGSIRYAENPPKKYQDIYPLNFWPQQPGGEPDDEAQAALWSACKGILDHWIGHGVRIFRVDNPHTKPMAFWEWLLPAVQRDHPDVLFLAEAFTTPKVMAKLAEVGFTQSYSYFTWRHSSEELTEYLDELAHGPTVDYLRPNFWPNTPDILGGVLRHGSRAAFELRLVLAALLAPNWGLYSGYELCENEPASPENEEYVHSEKYEIKHRDWDDPASLAPLITTVNAVRRAHPAFAELRSIRFHHADNEALLVFSKTDAHGSDPVLVVVNLDPDGAQAATLGLDLGALGLPWDADLRVHDELTGDEFTWHGPNPWVRLDPAVQVAHVLAIEPA